MINNNRNSSEKKVSFLENPLMNSFIKEVSFL